MFWSVWKFFKHLKHFSPGPDLLFSFTIQTRCFTKVNNRKTTVLSECLIIWMAMVILTSNWQTSLSFCLRIWYDKSLIWTEKHYNCKSVANVEIRLQSFWYNVMNIRRTFGNPSFRIHPWNIAYLQFVFRTRCKHVKLQQLGDECWFSWKHRRWDNRHESR